MKTHNAVIYHCIECGRVEHAELDAAHPQCCGRPMDKACGESVLGDAEEKGTDDSVAHPAGRSANTKPR